MKYIDFSFKQCFVITIFFLIYASQGFSQVPTITNFSPISAVAGVTMTINGANFAVPHTNNLVYFGGAKAITSAGTANSLTLTVPTGATSVTPVTVYNAISNRIGSSLLSSTTPFFTLKRGIPLTVTGTADYTNTTYTNTANQQDVAIADFNNDGFPDVVTVSSGATGKLEVRLNNGIGLGSVVTPTVTANTNANSMIAGLFDGDSFIDVVTANQNSSNITFFKGNGDGTFAIGINTALSVPTDITAADMDNDGILDLVSSHSSGDQIRIHKGLGTGSFTMTFRQYSTGNQPGRASIADLNRDGLLDIIVGNNSTANFQYFEQIASTNFNPYSITTSAIKSNTFEIADVNGDGFLDVLVGRIFTGVMTLHFGTGGSGATYFNATTSPFTNGADSRDIAFGDFDGDGSIDFVSADYGGSPVKLRLGDGAGGFGGVIQLTNAASATGRLEVADFDGDGKMDILSHTNGSTFVISYYKPATYYSTATGSWNTPSTWSNVACGGAAAATFPQAGDNVIICNTRTVTLTANAACKNLTINAGGTLELGTSNLTVGGTTDVIGILSDNTDVGTHTFNGKVTVSSTGIFSKPLGSSNAFIFNNDIEVRNNASLTLDGDGALTFSGVATQTLINTSSVATSMVFGTSANTNINVNQSLILAGTQNISIGAGNNGFVIIAADKIITNNNTAKVNIKSDLNGANINSEWINGANSTVSFTLNKQPIITIGKLTAIAVPNTVEYISTQSPCAGCEQVRAGTYHHLTTNNFTRNLAGNTTVNGNFLAEGGGGNSFNTLGNALTILGNFTNNSNVDFGASNINIGGNLISNRTITASTSTVTFNGNTAQTVSGTVNTTFNNLTINQGAVSTVTLIRPTTVTNFLTLTNGVVVLTNGNDLTVQGTGVGAIAGYSGVSYVRTKTSTNTANLVRTNLGVIAGAYYFPVGTDTEGYNLFAFSYGITPSAGNHSVKAITASVFTPLSPASNTKVIWEVLKPVGTNTNIYMDWQAPANVNGSFINGDLLVQDPFPYGNWAATGQTYNNPPSTATTFTAPAPFFGGSASPIRFAVVGSTPPPPTQPLGNRGMYFDGVDDYLSVPHISATSFAGNANYTVEMWVKLPELSSFYNLAVKQGAGGLLTTVFTITNTGGIVFGTDKSGTGWQYGTTANGLITINKWTHLAFVSNVGTKEIYVNGVSRLLTVTGIPDFLSAGASVQPWNFGIDGGFAAAGSARFKGQLDEIRIFNSVRNATDITSDMATQTPNGAVGYWNFEDDATAGDQTTAADLSGNANTGALTNGPLWALRVTNNTDNSGAGLGSLRQAITDANTDTDKDYIDFSIQQSDAATVSTITMAFLGAGIQNPLPTITESIFIDGYSAFGSSPNTANFLVPNNAQLRVELNCINIGIPAFAMLPLSSGLELNASNSTLRGLSIYGITSGSWGSQFGINISGGGTNTIIGNYIGLKADGSVAGTNGNCGLGIASSVTSNIIGGLTNGTENGNFNIISNHDRDGMQISGNNNTIQGNYIGTGKTGNVTGFGNAGRGVNLTGSSNSVIGNLISGNNNNGIIIQVNANSSVVKGNYIGIKADLSGGLLNDGNGIDIRTGASNSTIGGTALGDANMIAYNSGSGVNINGNTSIPIGNKISANSIFSNGLSGISLAGTPLGNNGKVAPAISSATLTTVSGTCICAVGEIIELFRDNVTVPLANKQGKDYLGTVATTLNAWTMTTFATAPILGDYLTATVTGSNDTSPFSLAFLLASVPTITSFTPISGIVGTSVTITGTNFNPSAANDVYFGAIKVTANANAGGTSITVNVPVGATSVTPIIVRNNANGLQASSMETITGATVRQFTVTNTPNLLVGNTNYIKTDFAVGTNPYSVAIGDFNGDGKADLATANFGSGNVSIRLGDGLGGFSAPTSFAVGVQPISVAVGDFNGDGKADLATANYGSDNVSILLGGGTGGFPSTTTVAVGSQPYSVAIGDFSGDGKADFATANASSNNVSIRLGDGTGGFFGTTDFAVGTSPYSVAIGDFNGDGKADFATANVISNDVSIRLGDGLGSFSGTTTVAVGTFAYSVAIGDFNGDGKADFATANDASNNVSIRLGDGLGGFSGTTTVAVGTNPYSLTIGDFNGDGKTDFATANNGSNNVSIRLGDGAGGFPDTTTVAVGTNPRSVAMGDFNGDGKADFATANAGSNNVSVLLYTTPPPVLLAATAQTANSFTANWTSTGATAYEVEVSTDNISFTSAGTTSNIFLNIGSLAANQVYYYRVKSTTPLSTVSNVKMTSTILRVGSGSAMNFNGGTGKYVSIPDYGVLPATNFTVEMWVNASNLGQTNKYLFGKNAGGGDQWGILYGFFANTIEFFVGTLSFSGADPRTVSQMALTTGWHHIVYTYNGINLVGYIDGIQQFSNPIMFALLTNNANLNAAPYFIGAANAGAGFFDGQIDEVKMWDVARSQVQIQTDMCRKINNVDIAGGTYDNMKMYLRFDENTGVVTENRARYATVDGTISTATFVTSGAALGNVSAYRYTLAGTASLPDFSAFFATGGVSRGIQVYKVNETPNAVIVNPSLINTLESSQYFGVFGIGLAANAINVNYNYTSNTNINGVPLEPKAKLYNRVDATATAWAGVPSVTNTVAKTISALNQNTGEYIAGFRSFTSVNPPGAGKALRFNGTNQYVDLGDNNTLDFAGTPFTFEAWIKMPAVIGAHQHTILGKGIDNTKIAYRFDVSSGTRRAGILIGDGTSTAGITTLIPIPDDQWTHIAVTYDGISALTIYQNGILENSSSSFPLTIPNGTDAARIGSLQLAGTNFFEGEIDEVRIWGVVRNQIQIREDMCQKLATPLLLPNLKGYYRLDEGAGSTTEDRSSVFGDGTLMNAPTWLTSGAALGDISGNAYDGGILAALSDGDALFANFASVPGQGVHVYKVREAPNNVALPAGITLFESSRYFGVYKVNVPTVNITYKYDANPNIIGTPEEFLSAFSERDNNADATWSLPLLNTGFGITMPNNRFMDPPNPITAIQREFMIGFTNSVPAIQASDIVFNAQTSNSIGLQWTNGSGTNRIVVASLTPNFTPPVNGTNYTVGQILGLGRVVYNSSGNIALVTGLNPQTQYYFFVYEYNAVMALPLYNTSAAPNNPNRLTTTATTPANQPTNPTTMTSPIGISGSFTPSVPAVDGYIGMIRTPDSRAIAPLDGTDYSVGALFPPSQTVVFVGNGTTFALTGLEPATEYILDIYAYNGTRQSIAYKKDNPLTIRFTTPALLPQIISIDPKQKNVGDKGFTLQVIGKNFIPKTSLLWNGEILVTDFVSKTELTTFITDNRLVDAGTYLITASSPSPGGGVSNAVPFTVIPVINIKNVPLISKIVAPDKNDHLLYRVEFISYGGETTLKQLKFTTGGSYQVADLKGLAFSLWSSADESLDASDRLLLTSAAVGSGRDITFDLSRIQSGVKLPKNKLSHLLLSVNIAKDAAVGREINIKNIKFDDIEFVELVTKQGLNPTQEGILQKIASANPTTQDYSALVKFFNEMKGKDWINPWNLNNPVNTWKGIELDEDGNVIAISLVNNNLVGKLSDAVMIDGVLTSKSLRYLNLSGNKIEGIIPVNIGNLTNLEYLDISNNALIGNLPDQIGKLTKLITLWAGYNQLTSVEIDFSNMTNLRNLFLPANNLTSLPDNLFNLKQLEVLDLQGNKLKTLPSSFGTLSKLKYLDISNNELVEMPQSVSNLTDLEIFFAHNNKLSAMPSNLTNLTKLQQFTIESNFLTFGTLESIRQWWNTASKTSVSYSPQGKIGKAQEIIATIGLPVTLSIATSGTANRYQWFRNGNKIDGATNTSYTIPLVSADLAGIYTVNISSSLVPNLVLQSHNIILLPDCSKISSQSKPMISVRGNITFCGSESVNTGLATAEGASITGYKWFLNGIEINNTDRSSIIARDAGRYRVQIQTTSGCSLLSEDMAIFLFPDYTVSITQTQANLIANSSDRQLVSYEWLLGNTAIEGANGQTFIPQKQGSYKVRATDINGCRSTSLPTEVSVVTAAQDNLYEGLVNIYPNPSESIFFLEIGKEKASKIELFNALGKFFNQSITPLDTEKYSIDLKNQAAGIYFVQITTPKGRIIKKIVKE